MSRFILLYQGIDDPPEHVESALLSALRTATVLDRMPGNILVEGPEAEIRSAARECEGWSVCPVQAASISPPHHQRIKGRRIKTHA